MPESSIALKFARALPALLEFVSDDTGTTVLYYRTADGIYAPVTLGTGLSFLNGVLSTTCGGGGGAAPNIHVGAVGMNLGGADAYSLTFPFLNRAKTLREWFAGAFTLDSRGYPIVTAAATMGDFGMEEPGMRPVTASDPTPDHWVIKWQGVADVTINGLATVGTPTSNRRVVANVPYDPEQNGNGTRSIRVNSGHPTDIVVVPLGEEALYDSGTTWFNPAYLALQKRWAGFRDMDWTHTNNNTRTSFESRPPLDFATWSAYRGDEPQTPSEVPLEVIARLAMETGAKFLHHTSPVRYTDAALALEAAWFRDNLPAGCVLRHEFSNEIWNYSGNPKFPTNYALAQGAALFADEGVPREFVWAGKRAAEAAIIARSAFSATPARLRTLLGIQAGRTEVVSWKEFGAKKVAGVTRNADVFDEIGIAPYVSANMSGGNDTDKATLLAKATANDIAWGLNQLEHGGTLTATDGWTVDTVVSTIIPLWANYAKANDLGLVCYEWGDEMVAEAFYSFTEPQKLTMRDYFVNLKNSAQYGAFLTRILTALREAGAYDNAYFIDISGRSKYGIWGARHSTYTGAPADTVLAAWDAAPPAPAPLTVAALGSASLYTGGAISRKVVATGGYPRTTVALTSGAVPGMTFSSRLKALTGTPATNGNYSLTFTATDSSGATASTTVNYEVTAPPVYGQFKLIITRNGVANAGSIDVGIAEAIHRDQAGNPVAGVWSTIPGGSEGGTSPTFLNDGSETTHWYNNYDNAQMPPFVHLFTPNQPATFKELGFLAPQYNGKACPGTFTYHGFPAANQSAATLSTTGGTKLIDVVNPNNAVNNSHGYDNRGNGEGRQPKFFQ